MADPLSGSQLLEAMKSYASGVLKGNTADTLGAPVDLINEAIAPVTKRLGMYSEEPVGGSKQFRKLLNQNVEDKNAAETAGSMLSVGGAAKAMIVGAARLGKAGKLDLEKHAAFYANTPSELTGDARKAELFNQVGIYSDKGAVKSIISDKESRVDAKALGEIPIFIESKNAPSLDKILKHPELFDLYPELKNVKVRTGVMPAGVEGQYLPAIKSSLGDVPATIRLPAYSSNFLMNNPDVVKNLRSTILHEAQHGIQAIEGWQSGGSTRQFLDFKPDVVQQRINAARDSNDPAVRDAAERFKTIANMKIREAGNRYSNLPGEQEARYTQETMNMSLPELTNNVLALIRSGNTPTTYDTRPIRPVFGGGDVTFKP